MKPLLAFASTVAAVFCGMKLYDYVEDAQQWLAVERRGDGDDKTSQAHWEAVRRESIGNGTKR